MFLEKEIMQIGNDLIKKASLEKTTAFSTIAPYWMNEANLFDSDDRIIYSIPERNFYEFKSIQPLFWEKFGTGAATFLSIQKMIIAHEAGHASQETLYEHGKQLKEMKSPYTLGKIGNLDELYVHIESYRGLLVKIEEEAWELGWNLIKDEENSELFDIVKLRGLETYKHADYLHTEEEFYETYQFLSGGNQVDLIGFKTVDNEDVIKVKIKWNEHFYYGELVERENRYLWLKEKAQVYVSEIGVWKSLLDLEDPNLVLFVIDSLKRNLKSVS